MNFSSKTPTFYSIVGSLGFHLVFVVFAGHYIVSQERLVPPVKKTYKLEVIEKKKPPPVKKRQIRKMVEKKHVKVLPVMPKVLPQMQTQTQVIKLAEVARVAPMPTPLKSMPLQITSTVSRQALVQTASASSIKRSFFAVSASRSLQSSKIKTSHSGGRLIQKGARRAAVPVVQARAIPSGGLSKSSQAGPTARKERGVAKMAFYKTSPRKLGSLLQRETGVVKTASLSSGSVARASTASFQPRPVPNVFDQGALNGYTRGIQRKIAARKEYPNKAKRDKMEGQVTVQFTVLKSGQIKNLVLVSKTPYITLNKAALNAVKRAAPLPGLPDEIGQDFLELELPFKFELKK